MTKYIKKPVEVEAVKWDGDFIVNGQNTAPTWVDAAMQNNDLFFQDQGDLYISPYVSADRCECYVPCPGYIVLNSDGTMAAYTVDRFEDIFEPSEKSTMTDYEKAIWQKAVCGHTFLTGEEN